MTEATAKALNQTTEKTTMNSLGQLANGALDKERMADQKKSQAPSYVNASVSFESHGHCFTAYIDGDKVYSQTTNKQFPGAVPCPPAAFLFKAARHVEALEQLIRGI